MASHHRPVDPERLRHLVSLPHGDSTVSPSFHPSGRLDDLPGSAGRLPAGSCSSRFASLPLIRDARKGVPVQGPLFRSDDRAPSLHEDYGSRFRHPSQVWGQDSSLPGRLVHPGLFGASLFTVEGQAPDCTELGIQVNLTKSSLVPTQSLVYLGMEIRSLPFIARPTPARVSNLLRLIEEFLSTLSPPAFLWRRLLGHLSSLTLLVPGGMLRMRLLQICLKDQWDFLDDQFQVSWSPPCREDLLWWARVARQREGVSLSLPIPDISFFSRRLGRRLGGPGRRTPCLGPLVSSSGRSLHQLERAVSSSVRPTGLRTSLSGSVGGAVLRQYHHSRLSLSFRRDVL